MRGAMIRLRRKRSYMWKRQTLDKGLKRSKSCTEYSIELSKT
jgi:hypothetical protein